MAEQDDLTRQKIDADESTDNTVESKSVEANFGNSNNNNNTHLACTDREDDVVLEELSKCFKQRGTIASLTGPPGVGKTFVAEKFIKMFPRHLRFWIQASTKASFRSSLINIYKKIVRSHAIISADFTTNVATMEIVSQVWEALLAMSKHAEWILVVDDIVPEDFNCVHSAIVLLERIFFPPLCSEFPNGRILLTSSRRRQHDGCGGSDTPWQPLVTQIKIRPLHEHAAVRLFLRSIPYRFDETVLAAKELAAHHFAGLPLAIVTSAAEIVSSNVTVKQYLDKQQNRTKSTNGGDGGDGNSDSSSIHAILDSFVEHLRSIGFQYIMDVVAWLNPDVIERHLLPADNAAVEALCAFKVLSNCTSYMNQKGSFYTIHHLFQAAARRSCSSPIAAIQVLRTNGLDAFSRHSHTTWSAAVQILPHVDSLRSCYHSLSLNFLIADKLACADLFCLGGHVAMWACADYVTAQQNYNAAQVIYTQVYNTQQQQQEGDLNKIKIAITKKDLGRVYRALGDYSSAREMYTEALSIMKADNNENVTSSMIVTTLHDLARVYVCLDERDKAMEIFRQVLQMKQQVHDSPMSIALTMANIARIHQYLDQHEQALAIYKEIQAMDGVNYWTEFGATTSLNEGQVNQELGNSSDASLNYQQALERYYYVHGKQAKNDAIATAHSYLGNVLIDICDHEAADFHLNKALEIMKHVFGATACHESIANVTFQMGRLHQTRGDEAGARRKFLEAKRMWDELEAKRRRRQLLRASGTS